MIVSSVHTCAYDDTSSNIGYVHDIYDMHNYKHILQSDVKTTHDMRIYMDIDGMDRWMVYGDNTMYARYYMIKKNLQKVVRYIGSYYRVYYYDMISIQDHRCGDKDIVYRAIQVYSDMIIHVVGTYDKVRFYQAAAGACYIDISNRRPIIGRLNINIYRVDYKESDDISLFYTLLHEVFHLLGFTYNTFIYFPHYNDISNTWTYSDITHDVVYNNISYKEIRLDNLTSYIRQYIGCNNISGVVLENNGSNGTLYSHWDKQYYAYDVMNPTTTNRSIISDMTIIVLRYTGWYTISDNSTQPMYYGYKRGCDFIYTYCSSIYNEYCSSIGMTSCSYDYTTVSTCISLDVFGYDCKVGMTHDTYCDVRYTSIHTIDDINTNSRCYDIYNNNNSNIINSRCISSKCIDNSMIIVYYNDISYTCAYDSQRIYINNNNEYILCPYIDRFCTMFNNRCRDRCQYDGNSICLHNNVCYCLFGNEIDGECSPYRIDSNNYIS